MAPDETGKGAPQHWEKDLSAKQGPQFMTLHEFAKKASQRIPAGAWDYLMGASETETTLKRNRMGIDAIAFKARVLRDVSDIDCSVTFMGDKIRMPVLLAPMGGIESFDPDGGASPAKASEAFNVPHMLSSQCSPGLEAVAEAANNHNIFQLYVRCPQKEVDDWVKRAMDNGYNSFCMTVDSAHYSRRERDLSKRYAKKWRQKAATSGMNFQRALSWDEVKHYKDKFPDYPLTLKGIATAEDTEIALEHGVEGIYVSNHGGRQLDHGRGSIEVLPEVVKVAKGKATIFVDGSFMRGSDIVKAMALGADIFGIGRLEGLALGADGVNGCIRMLEIIEAEIKNCMGLIGVTSFAELDESYLIRDAKVVTKPHQFSAFPLLNLDDDGYSPSI
ncbi:MAG: alpha-hydroxy acid oxidase [Rhodospirillales bacterium]